jgi:hypothetical protein
MTNSQKAAGETIRAAPGKSKGRRKIILITVLIFDRATDLRRHVPALELSRPEERIARKHSEW